MLVLAAAVLVLAVAVQLEAARGARAATAASENGSPSLLRVLGDSHEHESLSQYHHASQHHHHPPLSPPERNGARTNAYKIR